jgi:hypothetical protein
MSTAWLLLKSEGLSLLGCSSRHLMLCYLLKLTAALISRCSSGHSKGQGKAGLGRGSAFLIASPVLMVSVLGQELLCCYQRE